MTTTASIATANSTPAPDQGSDPYVLHGRPLRPGFRLEDTSRYSADIWRLRAAQLQDQSLALILNFSTVPDRFRSAAKQLFYSLLSAEPPDGEDSPEIATIRGTHTHIKTFLTWLDNRWEPHRKSLAEVSGADLEAFLAHLLATHPNNEDQRSRLRNAVRMLWRWRSHLGDNGLRLDPHDLEGWGEAKPVRRRSENSTDRLPEDVFGPLFTWSLRFIDDFATDILDANRQWQHDRAEREPHPVGGKRQIARRLQAMLDEHIAAGRPIPGYKGQPSGSYFARALECPVSVITKHTAALEAAAAVVGVAENAYCTTTIQGRLDGQPWVTGIAAYHSAPGSLAELARHTQAAAYTVIAFLSGMRDSEVKHLRRGCLEVKRDEDGTSYRWRVNSLAFKGEDETDGVPATWVVGEPVARAIKILEALQPAHQDYLFGRLPHGPGARKGSSPALSTKGTNRQLNAFAAYVNGLCQAKERSDTIAAGPGHRVQLKTSAFRRTLAWFIARRPGGVIAGAIQYRHHGIQMFEGYAGTSSSGFRAEVESEQAIARGEGYMEMIESHQHTGFAGPSAEEVARRLTDFGEQARFEGQVVLDKHRLARIMKCHDPAVYPGEYVTCVHDPAKALCAKARSGRGDGLPDGECQPLACRNVALSRDNTEAWLRELDRIEQRLSSRPAMAPFLHHRLIQRHAEIRAFLQASDTPRRHV
ncbi:hypothetical protein ABT124_35290 [Streptomyces sp. NPDC001982]|uniref:hypothetical protein n=1 Tax=Streptomyces sp. NPDC001982 TaxID=3154405 RepID=UPI00331DF94B